MGPRGGDELNLIRAGRNYGWPLVSEGRNYDGVPIPKHSTRPDLEPPKLYWDPVISPTSLMFYSGSLFPQWQGQRLHRFAVAAGAGPGNLQRRHRAQGRSMGHGRADSLGRAGT